MIWAKFYLPRAYLTLRLGKIRACPPACTPMRTMLVSPRLYALKEVGQRFIRYDWVAAQTPRSYSSLCSKRLCPAGSYPTPCNCDNIVYAFGDYSLHVMVKTNSSKESDLDLRFVLVEVGHYSQYTEVISEKIGKLCSLHLHWNDV